MHWCEWELALRWLSHLPSFLFLIFVFNNLMLSRLWIACSWIVPLTHAVMMISWLIFHLAFLRVVIGGLYLSRSFFLVVGNISWQWMNSISCIVWDMCYLGCTSKSMTILVMDMKLCHYHSNSTCKVMGLELKQRLQTQSRLSLQMNSLWKPLLLRDSHNENSKNIDSLRVVLHK